MEQYFVNSFEQGAETDQILIFQKLVDLDCLIFIVYVKLQELIVKNM